MPPNQTYTKMQSWSCEAGCQYVCHIISVEASERFLKVRLGCPTCQSQATRYWDLANHGWTQAMGIQSEKSRNRHRFVGSLPCESNHGECPFKEVKRLFRSSIELEHCIYEIARTAAIKCPDMTERQLNSCFNVLFDRNYHASFLSDYKQTYRQACCDSAEADRNDGTLVMPVLP